MRKWLSAILVLPLTGCISLGARPQDFDCTEAQLDPYWMTYAVTPLLGEIQRDAGHDNGQASPVDGKRRVIALMSPVDDARGFRPEPVTADLADPIEDLLRRADAMAQTTPGPQPSIVESDQVAPPRRRAILMLSGGAGWGAFGAGFLKVQSEPGPHVRDPLPRFDLVTGVSTGAMQALLVATGELDQLETEYRIDAESEIVKRGGLFGVVRKGYLGDTDPLRRRLEALLCDPQKGSCPGLEKIYRSRTGLAIGLVEARSGDFKVINLTKLISDAFEKPAPQRQQAVRQAAQCAVGVVMASAAVPVQMRPVRLGNPTTGAFTTYTDGGVRYSTFEAVIAAKAAKAAKAARLAGKEGHGITDIYIVRNGPTVVAPQLGKTGEPAAVDGKPDAGTIALRSYSTIVNQSELMSIAAMRLVYPQGSIRLATADGYGTPYPWRRSNQCTKSDAPFVLFDPDFMKCLVIWGEEKAREDNPISPWITLSELPNSSAAAR